MQKGTVSARGEGGESTNQSCPRSYSTDKAFLTVEKNLTKTKKNVEIYYLSTSGYPQSGYPPRRLCERGGAQRRRCYRSLGGSRRGSRQPVRALSPCHRLGRSPGRGRSARRCGVSQLRGYRSHGRRRSRGRGHPRDGGREPRVPLLRVRPSTLGRCLREWRAY